LSSKIAVLYGELGKEPLMPKNFVFWNPDEHKQIVALLEEKKPLCGGDVEVASSSLVIRSSSFEAAHNPLIVRL